MLEIIMNSYVKEIERIKKQQAQEQTPNKDLEVIAETSVNEVLEAKKIEQPYEMLQQQVKGADLLRKKALFKKTQGPSLLVNKRRSV